VDPDTHANLDAVEYLEQQLASLRDDDDVRGVLVIVERQTGGMSFGASYSGDHFRRLGMLRIAEEKVIAHMCGERVEDE
jgi:hypothetical protein